MHAFCTYGWCGHAFSHVQQTCIQSCQIHVHRFSHAKQIHVELYGFMIVQSHIQTGSIIWQLHIQMGSMTAQSFIQM